MHLLMRVQRAFISFLALAAFVAVVAVFSGFPARPVGLNEAQAETATWQGEGSQPVAASHGIRDESGQLAASREELQAESITLLLQPEWLGIPILYPDLALSEIDTGQNVELRWLPEEALYSASDLSPGDYELRIFGDAWANETLRFQVNAFESQQAWAFSPRSHSAVSCVVSDEVTVEALTDYSVRVDFELPMGQGDSIQQTLMQRQIQTIDGSFSFVGLPVEALSMKLVIEAEGYASGSTESLTMQGPTVWSNQVIRMSPIDAVVTKLRGQVVSVIDGNHLSMAQVRAVRPDVTLEDIRLNDGQFHVPVANPQSSDTPGQFGVPYQSADDGAFELAVRAGHPFRLWVYLPGFKPWSSELLHFAKGQLAPEFLIELAPAPSLAGLIMTGDEFGEFSVSGVELTSGGAVFAAKVVDGGFHVDGIPAGDYRVDLIGDADLSGYPISTSVVRVMPTGLTEVEIHCGTGLQGSVFEAEVPQLSTETKLKWRSLLYTGRLGAESVRRATANADGYFALTELADGDYGLVTLGISDDLSEYALALQPLRVPADCSAEIHALQHAPTVLHGRLLRPQGQSAGRVDLRLRTSSADADWQYLVQQIGPTTTADGQFTIHGLRPGAYQIETADGVESAKFEITSGASVQVDLAKH